MIIRNPGREGTNGSNPGIAQNLDSEMLDDTSGIRPPIDIARMEEIVYEMLGIVGEDPEREGLLRTPHRVAKAMEFLTQGYSMDIETVLNGAVFEERYDEMVIVKDIDFFSMCVPSRQLVNVVGGAKRAAAVTTGDKFWTLVDGRLAETSVTSITSRKARELVEVTTTKGVFRVTPDHPVATPEGWYEAQDLMGKQVEWTFPKSLHRRKYEPQVGYPLGYAVGSVFSDGTVGDRYISLIVNELAFAQQFAASMDEAFGTHTKIEPVERPSGFTGRQTPGYRVRVVSSYLADLFRNWAGGDAHHMRQKFPRVVLNSYECTQGFIDGYVEGDGHRVKNADGAIITSGNVDFLHELAEVVDARFTPSKKQPASQLYISDRWNKPGWFGKHGFHQEDHQTTLTESQYVDVLSVERIGADGKKPFTVYSFTCSPHPTFLIGGHLTHNCEHHMLPFFGKAHIAYIPNGKIVGLSKIPRIVDVFARRLQVQERMTQQIAETIQKYLQPQGVAVVTEASHMCMMMRGVQKQNSSTTASAMIGVFKHQNETRAEFMNLISSKLH